MADVDVVSEIVIQRPRAVVAAWAGDPANAPTWYVNIQQAVWETEPRVAVGARIAFVARFLGRELRYTYEIVDLDPGARLVMRTAQGPFPMQTTYTWEDAGPDATRMTLRNQGRPTGFSAILAPLMATMMQRATDADLVRLRALLEADRPPSAPGAHTP
ncbi:MAG: SRPBCC family protein [Alphaproteobacteria bacterium]|nr:SRPBCC family protein [Alphaproteobacteria bacterium]